MPPMNDAELKQIFENAHHVLEADGVTFAEDAQDWIISVAKGHPYYVHLLGKHSLIATVTAQKKIVELDTARDALADIAMKGTARIQETTYSKAIGQSYVREYILKKLASVEQDEIRTTTIYQELYQELSRDLSFKKNSISVYVGQLATEKFSRVIEKTRERHYRFRDSLFKAYAAARPFKYEPTQIDRDE